MARRRCEFVYETRLEFWKKKVVERGGGFLICFTKFVPSFENKKLSNGGGLVFWVLFTKFVSCFESKKWSNGGWAIFLTKSVSSFEKKKWSNGGGEFSSKFVSSFEKKSGRTGPGAIHFCQNLGRPEKMCWPAKSKKIFNVFQIC